MLIVGIDTSWNKGGIALARGDTERFELLDTAALAGGSFSAQLVPQLAALLAKHHFNKADVEGFAVASGPGSFTGLRVGLAAVKGLTEILHKPIAVVSVLEAMAFVSAAAGHVLTALDARRGEVYVGHYRVNRTAATALQPESLMTLQEFASQIHGGITLVTSDEPLVSVGQNAGAKVRVIMRSGADTIARLGIGKILRGETVLPEQLDANYLRRSDAEIWSKAKS